MRSKILPIILTCASASLARADFNPVVLTPSSYTFDIVVPATYATPLPYCINVTAGNGSGLGDNTYYEQGLRAADGNGQGANSGIPPHNTVFTNINNASQTFLMPPNYTTNNEIMVDYGYSSGTFTFNAPTTATSLSILSCGGGGALSINYTVTHADNSVETGVLNLLDWFNGGSTVAWGANGRITSGGGYNNYNSSKVNNNAPYLYANNITVSGNSPVVSIEFDTPSNGNHANLFAVSAFNGGTWTPVPVGGFNVQGIVPAALPLPVNATMDQGTNFVFNGLNTWFEQGYVQAGGSGGAALAGLPPSGTSFQSLTQPTHTYQMGNYYGANNAILIDANHRFANIVPATPAAYSAFAFLTAGGDVGGGNTMTNICILQHADGVQETNIFAGYDWFDNNHNGSIAFKAGGRVDLSSRSVNQINNNYPYMFESYFLLKDTGSPVTNIVLKYGTAPANNSTTFVMAVSASAGGVPPVVDSGPIPSTQTLAPGQSATFTVDVSGTAPITGYWQANNGSGYVTLANGLDANGSTIIGANTYSLTVSNLQVADGPAPGTSYQFVANNAFGTDTSPAGVLTVTPQTVTITPATPVYYSGNTFPLTAIVTAGPPVNWQWYYIDLDGNSNNIAGATNSVYTIVDASASLYGYTYGVIDYNAYGTNGANVTLSVSDGGAFINGDLSPLSAEAYAGAPVTYSVNAQGSSPITFQWLVNGNVVPGATSNTLTLAAPCGTTTIQASFTNIFSGGEPVVTSQATLQGDPYPTNITFNGSGINWQTNGAGTTPVVIITNNALVLTDGSGGEASSAFYNIAQYVGGSWTASYIYNSHGGAADGTAFVLQTTNATALGGGGGQLGYNGIAGGSLAFEINLYNGNNETPGIAISTDGVTGLYSSAAPVSTTSTDDVAVTLNFANGVLSASLVDTTTGATYTTNHTVGSLSDLLGGNVAYIGFTGGDGGASSFQNVRNFSFQSVLPPVALSASPVTGNSSVISWSAADPTYHLQTTTSLSSPVWVAGPTPVVVNGVNQVTVNVKGGSAQQFYRLIRVVCE